MRKRYCIYIFSILFAALLFAAAEAAAAVVSIPANKDNTMYSENGALSNGAGDNFFAGTTNTSAARRALISFPLTSLPSCVVIQGVTLTLNMSRTISGGETVTLHRILADWGEGTSNATLQEGKGAAATPGDATWTFSFFNTIAWAAAGGSFSPTVSASQSVSGVGFYSWSSAQMIADVQGWANGSLPNHGWILVGNEGAAATAKRFDSRTNPTVGNRPVLQITFFDCTPVESVTWGKIKSMYR